MESFVLFWLGSGRVYNWRQTLTVIKSPGNLYIIQRRMTDVILRYMIWKFTDFNMEISSRSCGSRAWIALVQRRRRFLFFLFHLRGPRRDGFQLTSTNRAFIGRVLYEITIFLGAQSHVNGSEFGYHAKQNGVSHSALYDIQIPRALNNS